MPSQTTDHGFNLTTFRGVYAGLFSSWAKGEEAQVRATRDLAHITDDRQRLQQVASDFVNLRDWPPIIETDVGPRFLWDMFSFFVGISASCQWPADSGSDSFDDDDDEIEGEDAVPNWVSNLPYWNPEADSRLDLFLCKPETAIKIFLSSYARQIGFIWSDANTDCVAPVLEFFVKYILRINKVLASDASFCACPALIEVAKRELSNIVAVSKVIPDNFSSACYLFFGWGTPENPGLSVPTAYQNSPPSDIGVAGWEEIRRKLLSRQDGILLKTTHLPGVVEHSMRWIKSILLPTSPVHPEAILESNIVIVDLLLDSYAQLIMEPMPSSWSSNELLIYSKPQVQRPPFTEIGSHTTSRPHNPFQDNIIVPIDPQNIAVQMLTVGMGLGGTWVQLVPKTSSGGRSIWFIDHLSAIIPSFWTTTF